MPIYTNTCMFWGTGRYTSHGSPACFVERWKMMLFPQLHHLETAAHDHHIDSCVNLCRYFRSEWTAKISQPQSLSPFKEGKEPKGWQSSLLLQTSLWLLVLACKTIPVEYQIVYSDCLWYCKTWMVQYQQLCSSCFCMWKTVQLLAVNALTEYAHNYIVTSRPSQQGIDRKGVAWFRVEFVLAKPARCL